MKILSITLVLILLLISIAEAHQPRIVFDRINSEDNPIIVTDPEISKAYYGELSGGPDYYLIKTDKPFKLYLNILVPYQLIQETKDFKVELRNFKNTTVAKLDGTDYEWKLYFESFAGDNYLQGPELRQDLPAGIYYMKVYSQQNQGKYTLAVGETESFPLSEIFKTFISVPHIKTEFFQKPLRSSFFNIVGLAMLITLIVIIFLIWLAFKIRKINKKRKTQQKR